MWADPIDSRYLLVINILHYKNADGTYSVDELWHKDLQLHRYYLKDLRVASPRRPGEAPPSARVLEDGEGMGKLTNLGLPDIPSRPRAALSTPRTLLGLWKAISQADVVHVGVGGWPYPLGWPAALFAKLQKKFLITVVESAPHRLGLRPGAPLLAKAYGHFHEGMARWAVNLADFSIFTQAEYRSSMHRSGRPSVVTNATWIDEATILTDADAARSWDEKPAPPLRLLFAGMLTPSKGLGPLMEATRKVAAAGLDLRVDLIGKGPMLEECTAFAASLDGPTKVRLLPQVPYGPEFFQLLRQYHAVLVPSLADEQPRVVYDAYSQAVPVIGSDTAGIRDCVKDGEGGVLLPPGDVDALAAAITRVAEDPGSLRRMGLHCLTLARQNTHVEMHRVRHEILKRLFQGPRPADLGPSGGDASPTPAEGLRVDSLTRSTSAR